MSATCVTACCSWNLNINLTSGGKVKNFIFLSSACKICDSYQETNLNWYQLFLSFFFFICRHFYFHRRHFPLFLIFHCRLVLFGRLRVRSVLFWARRSEDVGTERQREMFEGGGDGYGFQPPEGNVLEKEPLNSKHTVIINSCRYLPFAWRSALS